MLEDARGFLDEPPALFRARVKHGVELSLAHDHVHLPPEAGVAQQLLHVEKPAGVTVDGVLAAAVAEQGARDRHLGVVDRQRAIRVVDGEDDLCTTEGTLRRSPGEDHVFHLAAAQGLGTLLPHHPGEGIDDVGFARAVRPDDAGHPLLEGEGGRLGEGLEAFESQALEIHRPALLRSTTSGQRYRRAEGMPGRRHRCPAPDRPLPPLA
jgi:hypothetical protein